MKTSSKMNGSLHAAFVLACLTLPGFSQTLDSFNPVVGAVSALAVQPDGKVLVGDSSTLWRFNSDGSRDASWTTNSLPFASCVLIQPDGRLVVGGGFSGGLVGLNPDGTLDTGFTNIVKGGVDCLALQSDGKVVVGGAFTNIAGQTVNRIARLNADGSLDASFSAGATPLSPGLASSVYSILVQPDGGILVGGAFRNLDGITVSNIGALYPDGSVNTNFHAASSFAVDCLLLQPDGRILVGSETSGFFTTFGTNLWRLNPDGRADTNFHATPSSMSVLSVALQADGRILGGVEISGPLGSGDYLYRFNTNGVPDTNFTVQVRPSNNFGFVPHPIASLGIQADDKILIGGTFVEINATFRTNIGRFSNTTAATQSLSYDGANIAWLRGGTSPEVWRTTFEASIDGTTWTNLGPGTRIIGGWQLPGVSLPTNSTFRARGFLVGGLYNGSGWFAETSIGPPAISVQPSSRTNNAGTKGGISVQAAGRGPLGFQWFKNNSSMTNGGHVSGVFTANLTMTNISGADDGAYFVIITNSSGGITSQVANLTVIDPFITNQPASLATNVGQSVKFTVGAAGSSPLSYQWRKNGINIPGANGTSLTLTTVQRADAASYDAVITNAYGSATSTVVMLTINFAALNSFGFGAELTNGSAAVYSIALQPDSKVLVGGSFGTLGGQSANGLGRLNSDGSLDFTFNGSADSEVEALAVQEDGRIVAGGSFSGLDGQTSYSIGRLNPDGTLDSAFHPVLSGAFGVPISFLALQDDQDIWIGGSFTRVGGQTQRDVARLNPDGTLDTGFFSPTFSGFLSSVYSVAFQSDGELVIGGSFSIVGGGFTNIVRLDSGGNLDNSFTPLASGPVYCVALQPDEKILVGGSFTNLAGQSCTNFGRLNTDGTLDTSFTPALTGAVYTVALQTDGKILLGGDFTNLDGQSRKYIGRLNADGTLDPIFDPKANNTVSALLMQGDGKILLGGSFTTLAGQTAKTIARLDNTDPAVQTLSFDNASILWQRSGASPEVWRVSFDVSTNGTDWDHLGPGIRTNGGWFLSGLALPDNPAIRARGYNSGGQYNGSSCFLEAYAGRAVFVSQPLSRTNNAATPATFSVLAGGTPPLAYLWQKNGATLSDGVNVFGSHSSTLLLSNVFGADAGAYSVIVTNASGVITSAVATLTVVDPFITIQPSNQWLNAGQTCTLSVTATGTTPVIYQWRKEGTNIPGATATSLVLPNLQSSNAGNYSVLISNIFGSITSAVAVLGVNLAARDSFDPQASGEVYSILVQPDGKIVVGGGYGQTGDGIARLNSDGTLDTNFTAQVTSATSLSLNAMALQPDGRIVLGGQFSAINGTTVNYIGRLNPDGTLDRTFTSGANNYISCLALQPDGKILLGGYFTQLGPGFPHYLGRLNPDSSFDGTFLPQPNGQVTALAIRSDGKILAGGGFTTIASQPQNYLAQINPDGTLDGSFNPGVDGGVSTIAIQADGRILLGGGFSTVAGQPRTNLARLNSDGTLDVPFAANADGLVDTIALQTDGNILVGGRFSVLGGVGANGLGVLHGDGSRDLSFNPPHNSYLNYINCIALQPDGKILVGGLVSNTIIRLNNIEPASQKLTFDRSAITWLRNGASPEAWRTTFESSTDGTNWSSLGDGARISGGWHLSAPSVPPSVAISARGFIPAGYFAETTWSAPSILSSDGSFGFRSNRFGFNTRAGSGQVVVIEASTNLVSWTAVQTNVVTGAGLFSFTDPDSAKFIRRFYRARIFNGMLPPPNLLSNGLGFQTNGFAFNIAVVSGQTVIVETSTNLRDWNALTTNLLGSDPFYFTDPASTNFQSRFYRARRFQ